MRISRGFVLIFRNSMISYSAVLTQRGPCARAHVPPPLRRKATPQFEGGGGHRNSASTAAPTKPSFFVSSRANTDRPRVALALLRSCFIQRASTNKFETTPTPHSTPPKRHFGSLPAPLTHAKSRGIRARSSPLVSVPSTNSVVRCEEPQLWSDDERIDRRGQVSEFQ